MVEINGSHKCYSYYMGIVCIGADHRGFNLKETIKKWMMEDGQEVMDVGNSLYDQDDDYPDFAFLLGEKIVREKVLGILICGSGVGMVTAVNKVVGVRAGMCLTPKEAYCGRNDDDMNVLCLSADLIDEDTNREVIKTFLETPFGSEERYIRRINKIKAYESKIS